MATPDGGTSVKIERGSGYAIGHAGPDKRFATTEFRGFVGRPTVGPDGNAWFPVGEQLARVDAAGVVSTIGPFGGEDHRISHGLVTGPDGNLWGPTSIGHNLARISPSGEASFTPFALSRCSATDILAHDAERAADGTVWLTDWICKQLVRVSPSGSPTQIDVDAEPIALAPDAAGGMWFAAQQGQAGHVDAAGNVRHVAVTGATDVAVAPDGAAWFASHTCELARVSPAGKLARRPAPIPAVHLAFDPAGVAWFASYKQLVHGTASRPCEDRVRKLKLPRRISFATLRRDGVRIAGSERAFVERRVIFRYGRRPATSLGGSFVLSPGAGYRYHPRPEQLRKIRRFLARGERVVLDFRLQVTNAEIKYGETRARVTVTR